MNNDTKESRTTLCNKRAYFNELRLSTWDEHRILVKKNQE